LLYATAFQIFHNHQEDWQYPSWAAEKAFGRVEIFQKVKIPDVDRDVSENA